MKAIAFDTMGTTASLKYGVIKQTKSIFSILIQEHDLVYGGRAFEFDALAFRDRHGRASLKRIREAINYMTGFPVDTRHYSRGLTVAFMEDKVAEEIATECPRVVLTYAVEFEENIGDAFKEYIKYVMDQPIRETRSPTNRTERFNQWLTRRSS